MTLTLLLVVVIWLFTLIFVFFAGGVMGTRRYEEVRAKMICSKCGHKGD